MRRSNQYDRGYENSRKFLPQDLPLRYVSSDDLVSFCVEFERANQRFFLDPHDLLHLYVKFKMSGPTSIK